MQVFFSLLLLLDRLLPFLGTCLTLSPMRSPPYLFSASAAQGAKWGKSQGCTGAKGCPRAQTPFLGKNSPWEGSCRPPALPGPASLLPAPGPPSASCWSCPSGQPAAGSGSVEFSLFFPLKSGKSLSKHYIDQNARSQFGC